MTTLALVQAALAQQTGEVVLMCLTITHPSLAAPIRLVNDKQDLVRAVGTFIAFPFEVPPPSQADDELPRVQLSVDNVDRSIAAALDALDTEPTVTLEVVLASDPDTVEAGPFELTLRNTVVTAGTVTGEIGHEDVLNEPFPRDSFTPKDFPGLFS